MGYISEALYTLDLLEDQGSKSAINNYIVVLLTHMLKCKYQPEYENKSSWRASIWNSFKGFTNEFIAIGKGSLYKNFYLRQLDLDRLYKLARKDASIETGLNIDIFPTNCEWNKHQLSDFDFINDFMDTYGSDNQKDPNQISLFDD